jgi:hypothetical protein
MKLGSGSVGFLMMVGVHDSSETRRPALQNFTQAAPVLAWRRTVDVALSVAHNAGVRVIGMSHNCHHYRVETRSLSARRVLPPCC